MNEITRIIGGLDTLEFRINYQLINLVQIIVFIKLHELKLKL